MKVVHIRLDASDLERVRALRARGVKLSHLLREAIRAEHDRLTRVAQRQSVEAVLAEIYAAHPVGEVHDRRSFEVHHRCRFRKAVGRRVRRRMSR